MKLNLPVTNVETLLPENEFIYSRTDLKGVTEDANEAFCKVSGFTREELVGKSHNIVRHPDMPPEAFADLWTDLKTGRPWRGLVKNRRKDGGYYWVVANVSAVRENGAVVGYQSVRSRPGRDEVAAADAAYAALRKGAKTLGVEHGRAVRKRPAWLEALMSLRAQMTLVGLMAVVQSLMLFGQRLFDMAAPRSLELFLAGVALVYGVFWLFIYAGRVTRDLDATSAWLEQVLASGNLRTRFDLSRRDVIGTIARGIDTFVSSIQATLQGVSDITGQVAIAADDVDGGVRNVRDSAHKQSEATSSAAAAVEEVTVSIGEVNTYAGSTRGVAEEAGQTSRDGVAVIEGASKTIQSLADTVHTAAAQVESLGKRSEEISRITAVIKEIADQTNLLALNAAIEAARAGEQGRGFAVVADEVRKLAERTSNATQEISGMVNSIGVETHSAVNGMRTGAARVAEGVSQVNEAADSLRRMRDEMSKTIEMVSEIAHAANEQNSAMTDLARNLEQVAAMTEQNVAVVEQTSATVNYLEAVVARMRKAVQQYTV
ncbi:methyl-accepting chemotaxis protein [Aromatoleum anaerobium]|uniref:PAS domain-containing protein n=1 Tax=Aromatoleum anaerobium TaxID=182180 RepID=A0ABX1PRM1_9RHOO|nr:PAS domain-containing methyl-accepting chemotaxis protein [Aromatoleum anaerobium]MCK0506602.1 methyl-accepting chemotaxis protein [Aromatoleum anaerobium]